MNIETQIIEKAKSSNNILITSHKSPDGDSVGSSLALYHFLKSFHLNVQICHPDPAPKYLHWLESYSSILNLEDNEVEVKQLIGNADLIFALDYNEASRTGDKMTNLLEEAKAFKIMIDHHLNPSDFCDLILSDTSSCSTCQLIFEVIDKSGNMNRLNEQIGVPLYLGIMTDTGSFRFNSVQPKTHRIVATLLEAGVKQDFIHEQIYDVNTPDKLKLRGFATSEKLVILDKYKTAYIALSEEDLKRFPNEKGDTEGLVNVALSIEGVKIAAFFSEKEGEVKISFRSKGRENPVNMLSNKYFSGGGHANAAGGKFIGKLEDAIHLFLKVLPEYVD